MDVTPLYDIAIRLDAQAEILRGRAHLVAAQRDRLRWRSPAARRCRSEVDTLVADLLGCAGRATALADRVRTHAAVVAQHR